MFAELQPLWCVHLPQVGVAAVAAATSLFPLHTQSLPHPERIRVFITQGFSSE